MEAAFLFFSNLLFAIPQENQRNLVNYVLWEENESVDTDLAEIHCPSLAGCAPQGCTLPTLTVGKHCQPRCQNYGDLWFLTQPSDAARWKGSPI